MQRKMRKVGQGKFSSGVKILILGTAVGQGIYFLSTPLLTRLFSPEAFALFAIFTASVGVVSMAAAGRYDIAILASKKHARGTQLLVVSILTSFVTVILSAAVICAFEVLSIDVEIRRLGAVLYLVPLAIGLTAIISAFKNYFLLSNRYQEVAIASVIQPAVTALTAVTLGVTLNIAEGLIVSMLAGVLVSLCYCYLTNRELIGAGLRRYFLTSRRVALEYWRYPVIGGPSSVLNGVSLALPVMFLAKYYPIEVVGYYGLIVRVAYAPLGFITQSVSQIYTRRVSIILQDKVSPVGFVIQFGVLLIMISMPPMLVAYFYGADIFERLFGEEWRVAGELMKLLLPSILIKFVASTLSGAMVVAGRLGLVAIWQLISIISISLMFYILGASRTMEEIFSFIMITDVVLYLIYFGMTVYSVRNHRT